MSEAEARLERAGVPQPRLEAEWLLADLLGTDRGGLRARGDQSPAPAVEERFGRWIARRAAREPAQHIRGEQEFHGLSFIVNPQVLIPRPETEGLVDAALELDLPARSRVLDLGTGSGCIAIALHLRGKGLIVDAVDRSPDALEVARENARRHGILEEIRFHEGSFGDPVEERAARYDLVVSNPPYIAAEQWGRLQPEVRDYDPREALVPGPTGLEAYEEIAPAARALLHEGGYLILELGYGQCEAVGAIVSAAGFTVVEARKDYQGIPRILIARRAVTDRRGAGSPRTGMDG